MSSQPLPPDGAGEDEVETTDVSEPNSGITAEEFGWRSAELLVTCHSSLTHLVLGRGRKRCFQVEIEPLKTIAKYESFFSSNFAPHFLHFSHVQYSPVSTDEFFSEQSVSAFTVACDGDLGEGVVEGLPDFIKNPSNMCA